MVLTPPPPPRRLICAAPCPFRLFDFSFRWQTMTTPRRHCWRVDAQKARAKDDERKRESTRIRESERERGGVARCARRRRAFRFAIVSPAALSPAHHYRSPIIIWRPGNNMIYDICFLYFLNDYRREMMRWNILLDITFSSSIFFSSKNTMFTITKRVFSLPFPFFTLHGFSYGCTFLFLSQ